MKPQSRGAGVHAVHDPQRSPLLALLGPRDQVAVPGWVDLLGDQHIDWIAQRWDSETSVFTWAPTDRFSLEANTVSRSVRLAGVADLAAVEILSSIALDAANGHKAQRSTVVRIGNLARISASVSIHDLPSEALGIASGTRWRAWTTRFDIATADPNAEWDRAQIRLAVIKGGRDRRGRVLAVGRVSQPWLRTVLIDVLRSRYLQVSEGTLANHVRSVVRLSAFLAARPDKGRNPGVLTVAAMSGFTQWLAADPAITVTTHTETLGDLRAVLTEARALGFTDRFGLSATFTVRAEHFPHQAVRVRGERSFPDATFLFMMGQDHILGQRVHDLAASVCGEPFSGEVFVQALHASANYGRRPGELCRMTADRIRVDDLESASILYDNSKAGRDRVWLPIGPHSAAQLGAWITRLRDTHPSTSADTLRLLPKARQNPDGTRPLSPNTLSVWFRKWVGLLEQAIVIGHLHAATSAPLSDLCQAQVSDISTTSMIIGGHTHDLEPAVRQMLADYCHDLTSRHHGNGTAAQPAAGLPLFPCPIHAGARHDEPLRPVAPSRFDALGPHWLTKAARYRSPGIPGTGLGDARINPDDLQLCQFRHTYLQHLINNGESIFTVAELADHVNVQVTIDSYVRENQERLRDAVDELDRWRFDRFGNRRATPTREGLLTTEDITQALGQGEKEDCSRDHTCYECPNWAGDPSNMPEIKANVAKYLRTINVHKARPANEQKPGVLAYHQEQLDGWRNLLRNLQAPLDELVPEEQARVLLAAKIVREFREFVARGGINLARPQIDPEEPHELP